MSRAPVLALVVLAACAAPEPSGETSHAEGLARGRCEAPAGGDWGWRKLGAVRGLPEAVSAGDGVQTPAVLEHEGVLHLWFSEKSGTGHVLFHSESGDGGDTFAPPSRVLGLGEGRLLAYPSVWREHGAYEILFGSGSIRRATSVDGVHFVLAPGSVLSASADPNRFDALSVMYPSRVATEAGAVLFFAGYDGRRVRIGRAVEDAEGQFDVDPPYPVVERGDATEFDNAAVAQPHVRRVFGRWWMWYGGYDTSASQPGPYRVGTASSDDGIVWQKNGVALELSPSGTDAWSTRDPVVLSRASGSTMFYVGLGDDGRYRLHRAVSDVCVAAVP